MFVPFGQTYVRADRFAMADTSITRLLLLATSSGMQGKFRPKNICARVVWFADSG